MATGGLVQVKLDEKKLKTLEKEMAYIPMGLEAAVSRGINETVKKTKTIIKQEMHDELGIKKAAIGKGIDTKRASFRKWIGFVYMTGKRISLARFGVRRLASKNLSYKISNKEGQKTIEYHPLKNRVFVQKGANAKTKHVWWIPEGKKDWVMLRGPSVSYAFDTNRTITRRVKNDIQENLFRRISRNAEAITSGKARISKRLGYATDYK